VGWAALRVVRRGMARALAEHRRRSVDGARPYDGERELAAIARAYRRAVAKLLARFPSLSLGDARAEP